MGILETEVLITLTNNVKYYEERGYSIPRREDKYGRITIIKGSKIKVKVGDLPKGSSVKLTKVCDICGEKSPNQPYGEINILRKKGDGKDRCYNCGNNVSREKRKAKTKLDRVGRENKNKHGSKMKVISYDDFRVVVEFEDGYTTETNWTSFEKGEVRNPYDRSVYGIGYLGEGDFKTNITIDGKHKHSPAIYFLEWYVEKVLL